MTHWAHDYNPHLDDEADRAKQERLTRSLMPTFTGCMVDPFALHLTPQLIDIRDIIHSLATTVRWSGMGSRFYSVAEHSTRMALLVSSPDLILPALLHDASEAYFRDLPRPVKRRFPDYMEAEEQCQMAIAAKFGLSYPWCDEIHQWDDQFIHAEGVWLNLHPNPTCQSTVDIPMQARIMAGGSRSGHAFDNPFLTDPGWGWRYAEVRYAEALASAFRNSGRRHDGTMILV